MIKIPKQIDALDMRNGFTIRSPSLSKEDIEDYLACHNDKTVAPFVPDSCIPKDLNSSAQCISQLLESFSYGTEIPWIIVNQLTNRSVGHIILHSIDKFNKKAEIAYQIIKPYSGIGITSTACKHIIDFAFREVGLNRIEATTIQDNIQSMCFLQKLGFILEGIMSDYKFYKGNFVDIVMFSLSVKRYIKILDGDTEGLQEEKDILKDKMRKIEQISDQRRTKKKKNINKNLSSKWIDPKKQCIF